jgi:hypothetical protein
MSADRAAMLSSSLPSPIQAMRNMHSSCSGSVEASMPPSSISPT